MASRVKFGMLSDKSNQQPDFGGHGILPPTGFLRFRYRLFLRGLVIPAAGMVCAVYSTAINGYAGL